MAAHFGCFCCYATKHNNGIFTIYITITNKQYNSGLKNCVPIFSHFLLFLRKLC